MKDKKNTKQELISALLNLETASKENLKLLVKFLDAALDKSYVQNAKLVNASKAILKEIVTEDVLYGKSKTNPAIAPKITSQLDHVLKSLNTINNARKQLLADADKVKLSVTMLTGENLPKATAEIYNKSIDKILGKVNDMTAQLQQGLQLDMKHGKNFSKMSPQELAALRTGIASNIGTLLATNKQMKDEMKNGPANTEQEPEVQKPSPFKRNLRRG
jgi:hypothetical protein